jgi:hypothetical protein
MYPLGGDSAVERAARGSGTVAARAIHDRLGKFELRVVVASRHFADRVATTANRRVGSRDPDAINLNTALDRTNAEWNLILGLFADGSDWLCLEHLRCRSSLSLVDCAVLLDLVGVVP